MAAFVDPSDVALRLGRIFTDQELFQVGALCDDVSGIIRARRPQIDTWIADGDLPQATVVAVACQVVARVLTTVDLGGVGIVSETHPEYAYELSQAAAAGLRLTQDELDLLTPVTGRRRAFSIQPG